MTDQELIQILDAKLPQELTAEEIARVRNRLKDSPALRQALSDRLLIDQSLSAVLGQISLTPEQIIARGKNRPRSPQTVLALWGIALVLLVACGVGLRVWLFGDPQALDVTRRDKPVEQVKKEPVADPNQILNDPNALDPTSPPLAENGANTIERTDPNAAATKTSPSKQPANKNIRPNWLVIEAENFATAKELAIVKENDATFLRPQQDAAMAEYEIQVPKAGEYRLELRYRNLKPAPLRLYVNNQLFGNDIATNIVPEFTADPRSGWVECRNVTLNRGKNQLRLEARSRKDPQAQLFPDLDKLALQSTAVPDVPLAEAINAAAGVPWLDAKQLAAEPRSFAAASGESYKSWGKPPTRIELRSWLEPRDGFKLEPTRRRDTDYCFIEGTAKFRPPLQPDHLLRVALSDQNNYLKLHCWNGNEGYSFQFYEWDRSAWVVYHATRNSATDAKPSKLAFVGSDEDRNHRLHTQEYPQRFDLRWDGKFLVLCRAGFVLLRVPFTSAPEIYFEGRGVIHGISLVRVNDATPAPLAPPAVAKAFDKPSELDWKIHEGKGVVWTKRDDGAVELTARERAEQPAWATIPIDLLTPGLIELELEIPQPGARVILSTHDDQPKYGVGFFQDRRSENYAVGFASPFDGNYEQDTNPHERISALAGKRVWIRLQQAPGHIRAWLSDDGESWGRAFEPMHGTDGGCVRLGIMIPQSDRPRSIILRRIALREIPPIFPATAPELLAQIVKHPPGNNLAEWEAAVAKSRPEKIAAADWRRANAIRALALGANRAIAQPLLIEFVDEALKKYPLVAPPQQPPLSPEKFDQNLAGRLAVLEAASWSAHTWDDSELYPVPLRWTQRYEQLARQLAYAGQERSWSKIWPQFITAPFWSLETRQSAWQILARHELLSAIYADNTDRAAQLMQTLRGVYPRLKLLDWSNAWLAARLPNNAADNDELGKTQEDHDDRGQLDRRHPYVEEISKDGFNLIAELNSALGSKAYRDACQIITQVGVADTLGLLPDDRDPQLFLALPAAVSFAMGQDAELRRQMTQEFAPLGLLRFRKAEQESDAAAMEALTTQYYGTAAAAAAHAWLGERALSGGEFAAALAHFQAAVPNAPAELVVQLPAKQRLAAALLGREWGKPVTSEVMLGERAVPPGEFERLVGDYVKERGRAANGFTAERLLDTPVPPLGEWTARELARFDGDVGNNPNELSDAARAAGDQNPRFDWVGKQLFARASGEWVLAANRFQVSAYERNGNRVWRSEVGNDRDRTHAWPLIPMRITPVGERIFVRRLPKTGPELVCLERKNGNVLWQNRLGLVVISDPIWDQQQLRVLTLNRGEQESQIVLTTLDPATGAAVEQHPLLSVCSVWDDHRTAEIVQDGERIYGVLTGLAFCANVRGRLEWVRKQTWLAARAENDWGQQAMQPPLLHQGRLYLQQPGVKAIECLDPATGRLLWRSVLPGVRRMLGIQDDRLLVQDDAGIVALGCQNGDFLWSAQCPNLLDGYALASSGPLWLVDLQRGQENKWTPELLWLDPATGQELGRQPLNDLRHDQPYAAPLLPVSDGVWWLFSEGGRENPQRKIWELKRK